jgi:hypothetical protein
MDLQETEGVGTDWIDLAQDRDRWPVLVNAVKKCGEFLDYLRNC